MEQELLKEIEDQLLPRPPQKLGVAVSGGGDSVALLFLLAAFAKQHPIELHVISVDHGLRAGSKDEVRFVTDVCGQLGVEHHVEYWGGWDGGGNLQDRAREARISLIGDWAVGNEIATVALGHTANDQAETLLMRLARGAGVDGLSAMAPRRVRHGVTWVRPMLGIERRSLRDYLRSIDVPWIEDPSNEDRSFERVRMRDALKLLEPLGFSIAGLTEVAQHMNKAREALDWQTFLAARDVAQVTCGTVLFDKHRYRTLPEEIGRRLLLRAVGWISQNPYPPRRKAVAQAQDALREGRTTTLDGCQIQRDGDRMWVFREFNAVKDEAADIGDLWDDRWYLDGPEDAPEFQVRALGSDGLAQVPDWRDSGFPRAALLSMPAVWKDGDLIAAPVFGDDDEWSAEIDGGQDAFFAALLSH